MSKNQFQLKKVSLDKMVQIVPGKCSRLNRYKSQYKIHPTNSITIIKKNPHNTIKNHSKYLKKLNAHKQSIHGEYIIELLLKYKLNQKNYSKHPQFPKRQELVKVHEKTVKLNPKQIEMLQYHKQSSQRLKAIAQTNENNLKYMYFSARLTKTASDPKILKHASHRVTNLKKRTTQSAHQCPQIKAVDISPWIFQQKEQPKETFQI